MKQHLKARLAPPGERSSGPDTNLTRLVLGDKELVSDKKRKKSQGKKSHVVRLLKIHLEILPILHGQKMQFTDSYFVFRLKVTDLYVGFLKS